jgi:Ca2+-binding RTX toxin-like protein
MLVRVPIRNDSVNEPDETFFLRATNTGGTTAVGTATIVDDGYGTIFNPNGSINTTAIKDNDGTAICPEVSIGNCRVEEPDFGQSRMANLVISLSEVATGDVTVTYATALATQSDVSGRVGSNGLPIGIATANTDFTPVQGSVVIKAGSTSTTVRVPIIGDYQAENDEVLYTRITGVTGGNAKVSPTANRGEILIVDNDCGCNNQVIDRSTSTVAQTIHGGTGNDVLTGSPCPDTINGYGGKDFIAGGAGADALTGGLDADVFAYRAISHSAGSVIDRILDFAPGSGGDRFQFLDSAATTLRTATASAVADGLPKALFNASRSVPATTLSTAISQAFTDKNLALAGNQALATGEAVIVNQASGSTIKSYLIVNVGLASYQSGTDFIADITGWQSTGFPSSQLAVTDFFRSSIV